MEEKVVEKVVERTEGMVELDLIEQEIKERVALAEKEVDNRLVQLEQVTVEIKQALVRGVDTLDITQIQTWLLILALEQNNIAPQKESFGLAKDLYKIEKSKREAERMRDRGSVAKVDITNENVLLFNDYSINQAVVDYITGRLKEAKESVTTLIQVLKKILDSRLQIEI